MINEILLAVRLLVADCSDFELPTRRVRQDCARVEYSVGYVRCHVGNPRVTAAVNALIEKRVREEGWYEEAVDDEPDETEPCEAEDHYIPRDVGAGCETPYVMGNIISISCGASWTTGVHPDGISFAINLRAIGDDVREVTLSEILNGPAAEREFWGLVRDDVRCQLENFGGDPAKEDPEWVEERLEEASHKWSAFNLGRDGLRISFHHSVFGYAVVDSTIPYEKLSGVLVPGLKVQRPN